MKKYLVLAIALFVSTAAWSQHEITPTVKVRGTRLTYPLVKKWIAEFNKDYPNIKVAIAPQSPSDSIDISIVAYKLEEGDLDSSRAFVSITRYTQLPVVNSQRKDLKELQAKGFTKNDFQAIYFPAPAPATTFTVSNDNPINLYTRDKPACAAVTFARHYGQDPKSIKGTGVKGDDQDLATAVKKDVHALSFNNLGFIYDVSTRKVTDGLAVVPLDLNENGKTDPEEKVYDNLDQLVAFIEKTNHPSFVTEHVNATFRKNTPNQATGIFLNWVLTKGQALNHELGFLNLEPETIAKQSSVVSSNLKLSSPSCEGASEVISRRKKANP